MAQRTGPPRIFARPKRRARMREGSCLSQATFSWIRPVLALGSARTIDADDLLAPRGADTSANAAAALRAARDTRGAHGGCQESLACTTSSFAAWLASDGV